MTSYILFSSLSLLFGASLAVNTKFIHNANEFIKFSNEVNRGTSYKDYTVYLAADIDFFSFSSQYKSISGFLGTFDGQGYVISNLTMNSPSFVFVGLFGSLYGSTIKNVVIDKSCSFLNSYTYSDYPHTGGFIGRCEPSYGPCVCENCVNMASLSFTGKVGNFNTYLGGIIAHIHIATNNYETKLINCVNYGTIYNSGSTNHNIFIGGIAGDFYKETSNYKTYLYNCLNYGTVSNVNTVTTYYTSGIVARCAGITITNCVNAGTISSAKSTPGSLINSADYYSTTISHCYWKYSTSCTNYYAAVITIFIHLI